MNQALNMPVQGSYENMVKATLQQNPQLAQQFKQTMERYGNIQNPWQVLAAIMQERGMNPNNLRFPRR